MVMNQTNSYKYTPNFGRIVRMMGHGFNPEDIRLVYNEVADELVVFLPPNVEHSVALDTSDNVYLLLDPESEDVVGFQFDNFLSEVVLARPQLLTLASLAGIDPLAIERARERIGDERARRAAIESVLRDLFGEARVGR